jgi:hypothetical protein
LIQQVIVIHFITPSIKFNFSDQAMTGVGSGPHITFYDFVLIVPAISPPGGKDGSSPLFSVVDKRIPFPVRNDHTFP